MIEVTKKHSVTAFFILTFLLTGLLFGAIMLWMPGTPYSITQFAPVLAAIIVISIKSGKTGLAVFFKSMMQRTKISYIVVALIAPAALLAISSLLMDLIAGNGFGHYGTRFDVYEASIVAFIFIAAAGEEIGWRGYAIPLLSNMTNRLKASIIVGLIWGVWHLNNIVLGFAFLLYIIWTVEISIIMTWLHFKGNRNIALAVIFHAIINITALYVFSFEHFEYTLFLTVQASVCAIPAAILVWKSPVFARSIHMT